MNIKQNYIKDFTKKLKFCILGERYIKELKNIKRGDCFACGGIGDTLYACIYIDRYIEEKKQDGVTLYVSEGHKDIVNICQINKAKIVFYPDEKKKAIYYYLVIMNRIYPHYKYKLIHIMALRKKHEELSKHYNLAQIYQTKVFEISENKSSLISTELRVQQKYYEIKENSVLIIPDSNSIPSLKRTFWIALIEYICRQKINVYLNGGVNLNIQRNYIFDISHCSIKELFYIAPQFKYIISVRNGLCDLLAKQYCNLIVLYPDNARINTYQYFTLKNIQHNAFLTEISENDYMDQNTIIKKIDEIICGNK